MTRINKLSYHQHYETASGERIRSDASRGAFRRAPAYGWLARIFELLTRVKDLSFKHHYEAASVKQITEDDDGKLYLSDEPDQNKIGELLAEAKQWAIGDWLLDGKQHYGDGLYKRAAEITGLDEGQLRNFKSMADCFELSQRCDKLRWTQHREVASIKLIAEDGDGTLSLSDEPDTDKIAELLAEAEKKGWSVVELRAKVRAYKEWQRQHIAAANEPEKYPVMYADPPWQYTSGAQLDIAQLDHDHHGHGHLGHPDPLDQDQLGQGGPGDLLLARAVFSPHIAQG